MNRIAFWVALGCVQLLSLEALAKDGVSERVREVVASCSKQFVAQPPEEALKAALASGEKLLKYFEHVQTQFFERDYVINALEVGLIGRQPILLVGAPGNGKTEIITYALSNIVEDGKPSFFTDQMTFETTLSDTHGSLDFKQLMETGRQTRFLDEGVLGHRFSLLDEQFDMRPNAFRNILTALSSGSYRGQQGKSWLIVGASNKTLPEVYARFDIYDDSPRALVDRYGFVLHIGAELMRVRSNRAVIQNGIRKIPPPPVLEMRDLIALNSLLGHVELPDYVADLLSFIDFQLKPVLEGREAHSLSNYLELVRKGQKPSVPPWKSTKYMSPRTEGRSGTVLKAMIILDWVKSGGDRPLVATVDDLEKLIDFYSLGGPPDEDLTYLLGRTVRDMEKDQINTVKIEREIFRELLNGAQGAKVRFNATISGLAPMQEIMTKVMTSNAMSAVEKAQLEAQVAEQFLRAYAARKILENSNRDALTPELIAQSSLLEITFDILRLLNKEDEAAFLTKLDKWLESGKAEAPPAPEPALPPADVGTAPPAPASPGATVAAAAPAPAAASASSAPSAPKQGHVDVQKIEILPQGNMLGNDPGRLANGWVASADGKLFYQRADNGFHAVDDSQTSRFSLGSSWPLASLDGVVALSKRWGDVEYYSKSNGAWRNDHHLESAVFNAQVKQAIPFINETGKKITWASPGFANVFEHTLSAGDAFIVSPPTTIIPDYKIGDQIFSWQNSAGKMFAMDINAKKIFSYDGSAFKLEDFVFPDFSHVRFAGRLGDKVYLSSLAGPAASDNIMHEFDSKTGVLHRFKLSREQSGITPWVSRAGPNAFLTYDRGNGLVLTTRTDTQLTDHYVLPPEELKKRPEIDMDVYQVMEDKDGNIFLIGVHKTRKESMVLKIPASAWLEQTASAAALATDMKGMVLLKGGEKLGIDAEVVGSQWQMTADGRSFYQSRNPNQVFAIGGDEVEAHTFAEFSKWPATYLDDTLVRAGAFAKVTLMSRTSSRDWNSETFEDKNSGNKDVEYGLPFVNLAGREVHWLATGVSRAFSHRLTAGSLTSRSINNSISGYSTNKAYIHNWQARNGEMFTLDVTAGKLFSFDGSRVRETDWELPQKPGELTFLGQTEEMVYLSSLDNANDSVFLIHAYNFKIKKPGQFVLPRHQHDVSVFKMHKRPLFLVYNRQTGLVERDISGTERVLVPQEELDKRIATNIDVRQVLEDIYGNVYLVGVDRLRKWGAVLKIPPHLWSKA